MKKTIKYTIWDYRLSIFKRYHQNKQTKGKPQTIFTTYVSDKEILPTRYTYVLKFNSKKTNNPITI